MQRHLRHPSMQFALCLFGGFLVILSPIVGVLPGPGGIVLFAFGMGLLLKNSLWAKRRYVGFKRRWPKAGGWADWGMRRRSARRRQAMACRRQAAPH